MANDYYNHATWPASNAAGTSSLARAEYTAIEDGFDKLPVLAGNASQSLIINAGATALTGQTAAAARTLLSLVIGTDAQAWSAKLDVFAALTTAANKVPRWTSASAADVIDFRDEDVMTSDDATSVASQQSIKAYIDTKVTSLGTFMRGPTGTVMAFYQAAAPTGWTIKTGLDGRVVTNHISAGATTYGTHNVTAAYTSNTVSANHRHTWSGTSSTGASSGCNGVTAVGTTVTVSLCAHPHSSATSGTTDYINQNHSHNAQAAKYSYVILATRDA